MLYILPCGSFFNLLVRTRAPSIRGLHGSHSPSEQSSRTTHTLVVPMLATDVPQYLIIIQITHNVKLILSIHNCVVCTIITRSVF